MTTHRTIDTADRPGFSDRSERADRDPTTVVLADDHTVVRQGMRMLVDHEPALQVVAEAGTVPDAEPMTRAHRPDDLNEREVEVLRLIALGHTNGEIAQHLCRSTRTVETHRAHIQRKLRRISRAELVRYALERHLIAV